MKRAGFPPDALENEGKGITSDRFFDIWRAAVEEFNQPDLPLTLGLAAAHGPTVPSVYAFTCSRDIESGLSRLALFKPLTSPMRLLVERDPDGVVISFTSGDNTAPLPDDLAAVELVYFLELSRLSTTEHIVPLSVGLPGDPSKWKFLEEFFGVPVGEARRATMTLSLEDAHRRLISEDLEFLAGFEKEMKRQLAKRKRETPVSARVKSALLELLPVGQCTADEICGYLHVSKRSLYRHLKNEGESYQGLLDATRSELSLYYLSEGNISVEEISYLLAFRDPNSFYRAFKGWTGMTPAEARGKTINRMYSRQVD